MRMSPELSILTVSTLFPNSAKPSHGIFVEARLRKLRETGEVKGSVLAPVPWLPPFLRYQSVGRVRDVPRQRIDRGLVIRHPRYVAIPKIGMSLAPFLLARTLYQSIGQLLASGERIDLIDAHYFYPDGVAAVWAARRFGLPVTVTARGTDLNLIPQYPVPRRLIREAAGAADGLITVCAALREPLCGLGIAPERVTVLRNGVDLDRFRPVDREAARQKLGLTGPTLLSVGHLIARKGHHHAVAALAELPEYVLLVVGDGEERARLAALAQQIGVAARVRFLGALPQGEIPEIYGAADALVLASSREGWANVLLEAMACGTPVVASAIWGTPEVVTAPEAGVLMPSLDAKGVVAGIRSLERSTPDRAATRRYAEQFSWAATTEGQLRLFRSITEARRASVPQRFQQ